MWYFIWFIGILIKVAISIAYTIYLEKNGFVDDM